MKPRDLLRYRFINEFIFVFFSIIFYCLASKLMHASISSEFMLIASDSLEYFSTGFEFFDHGQQGASIVRPWLFSFLFRFSLEIGGPFLFWFWQFFAWTASAFLLFKCLKQSMNLFMAYLGGILFFTNASLINLSYFGLTEIITVFILSIWLFISAKNKFTDFKYLVQSALILSVLCVIKPLFVYPLLLWILAIVPICYFRKIKLNLKGVIYLILALSPVLFQISMMKLKYGKFQISNISSKTVTRYIVTQGIGEIENIPRDTAMIKALAFKGDEEKEYISKHKDLYFRLLQKNLEDNISAEPTMMLIPKNRPKSNLYDWMKNYNKLLLDLFYIFIVFILLLLLKFLWTKQYKLFFLLSGISFINYYIIFTSSISFFQADRLTIIALPLTIFLYLYFILELYRNAKRLLVKRSNYH